MASDSFFAGSVTGVGAAPAPEVALAGCPCRAALTRPSSGNAETTLVNSVTARWVGSRAATVSSAGAAR